MGSSVTRASPMQIAYFRTVIAIQNIALMKIICYARVVKKEQIEDAKHLIQLFAEKCEKIFVYPVLFELFASDASEIYKKIVCVDKTIPPDEDIDYCVALGGDGSFLDIATIMAPFSIPVIGINFGRLGFLTDISIHQGKSIVDRLEKKEFFIENRSMLKLQSDFALDCFGGRNFAINEITMSRKDTSTLITLEMLINGKYVHTYWADGVIISTPTGSTGYNLSCNGPIVFPSTSCIIITPYASHNLNVRPLVLPEDVILEFHISCRTSNKFICMLDARREELPTHQKLVIQKNDFPVQMIKITEYDFINALVEKLNWGVDVRNK